MYRKIIIPLFIFALFIAPTGCINESQNEATIQDDQKVPEFILLTADLQTIAVRDTADAADDPAIWIHPEDPERSLIIGTNKKRGLAVYKLNGEEVSFAPVGRANNVDIRYRFPLGDRKIDLVGASNRTYNSLCLMAIDTSGQLYDIAADTFVSLVNEVYGFCFYHNKSRGEYYAIINSKDGEVEQWLLSEADGRVHAELIRSFEVGGQTEGCVADDENGNLFIGQENHGIWKYHADPGHGNGREAIDDFSNPMLKADIEGLSIYYAENGEGYLIVSSQGNNSYAIYNRKSGHEYLGSFRIVDKENGIDGTADTDGIDVINLAMGNNFPNGFFIAQDGFNFQDGVMVPQNFKLVRWEKIASSFDPPLIIDNTYNIRD